MSLAKPPSVAINPKAPWDGDPFDREVHGQRLLALVRTLRESSYVIAINGDWGTGKSVFLQRLEHHFEQAAPKIPFIRVDAWASDDAEDPLIPFVAALNRRIEETPGSGKSKARNALVGAASKLAVPTAALIANFIAPGSGTLIDSAAKFGQDMIDWETERASATEKFRTALVQARDLLTSHRDGEPHIRPIVVAIDELDRCRPDFSVKALERIKHFFNVPGVVFLIATDRGNLPAAVKSVYGESVDGERYLRKFFDYEYRLPEPTPRQYIAVLWREFKMDEVLPYHNPSEIGPAYDGDGTHYNQVLTQERKRLDAFEYFHVFSEFSELLGLSLRDQAQAFTMLSAHIRTMPARGIKFPAIDCLVVCMRFSDPQLFREIQLQKFRLSTIRLGAPAEQMKASPGLRAIAVGPYGKALAAFIDHTDRNQLYGMLEADVRASRERGDTSDLMEMVRIANRLRISTVQPNVYVQELLGLVHSFSRIDAQ